MEKRRVVVTGLGTVNPTGNSVAESWAAIRAGQCGIGPITAFDITGNKVSLAAEVKNFVPENHIDKREARKMARFTQFAVYAAAEAMADSGLFAKQEGDNAPNTDAARFGTIVGSGIGGLPIVETEYPHGVARGFEKISPFFVPMTICNMAPAQIAIRFGLQGMCSSPVTACASGTNAIGDAFHRIRDGYEDVVLCGGAESCISHMGMGGFASMKALTTATDPARASIPFDAERSGFVIGEGCGILILEGLEHAQVRGAKIYAEVVGYGTNCDAYHFTAPVPGGAGGAACMELALADAALAPEKIDYINAHGTSTHLNDSCETAAIKTAFGSHANALCVSSTKSMTGHLLGGAGGIEGIFTALALHDGFIPATIGLQNPDPECDLDYVPNIGREQTIEYAMSDSLGFGGHNACIIMKRWEG